VQISNYRVKSLDIPNADHEIGAKMNVDHEIGAKMSVDHEIGAKMSVDHAEYGKRNLRFQFQKHL